MPKVKLTKTSVDKLPATNADVIYWDELLPGFGVRVKASGIKSYVIQYRNRETGRSRRKTLGQHGPLLSFRQAKELAKGHLSDVVRGQDPGATANANRISPTVMDLTREYLTKHAIPKKRPRSIRNDRSMINGLILPKMTTQRYAHLADDPLRAAAEVMAAKLK